MAKAKGPVQQNTVAVRIFPGYLKMMRETHGNISQMELALMVGLDPGYNSITKYESKAAGTLPAREHAVSMADAFELEGTERAQFILAAGHHPDEGTVVIDGVVVYDFELAANEAPIIHAMSSLAA